MATAKKAAPKNAPKTDNAAKALEDAKKKFADAQKKLQEQRGAVTKAKRLIATGDKKLAALDKKIEETKDAPTKAVELLLKKAEEMEKKAAEMAAEQETILADAEAVEEKLEAKQGELAKAKEEADAKLEELGIPKKGTRSPAVGTAAERRQKNNFQYRLKSKGWEMLYNTKGRIEGAEKYGLTVTFEPEQYTITGGTLTEVFAHPYGEGCLTALAEVVKNHGEGADGE